MCPLAYYTVLRQSKEPTYLRLEMVRRAVVMAALIQLQLLKELYGQLRLYTNFFLPTMKLKAKERVGSRVKKRYDKAQMPYQQTHDASSFLNEPTILFSRTFLHEATGKRSVGSLHCGMSHHQRRSARSQKQKGPLGSEFGAGFCSACFILSCP